MAVTAAAGVLSFGPQIGKGTLPASYYKTKVIQGDLSVMDDIRTGDDEVGDRPVPTFPYKAGVLVGGGLTMQPRLENILGWLLYAAMGKLTTVANNIDESILESVTLTGLAQPGYTTGVNDPRKTSMLAVRVVSGAATGNVVINGKDEAGVVINETVVITGGAGIYRATTQEAFALVDSLDLPASDGVVISVGCEIGNEHIGALDPANPSATKWMGFRKHIPREEDGADTDLGEIYTDCKIVSLGLTLASETPLQARLDVLGRTFALDHDPTVWTYANAEFEDYHSVPLGTDLRGYIQVGDYELPVVQANITWQNVPLDVRRERIVGSPYLRHITTVRRQLALDLLVQWENPNLYAQILTGNAVGTSWTGTPFTGALDLVAASPATFGTKLAPYSLRIKAASVMLSLNGGITLAGGQSVLMRFNGIALDPSSGEYATIALRNNETGYTWPV